MEGLLIVRSGRFSTLTTERSVGFWEFGGAEWLKLGRKSDLSFDNEKSAEAHYQKPLRLA